MNTPHVSTPPHPFLAFLREGRDKLERYAAPTVKLSRSFAGERDVSVLEALLQEAVSLVDAHARRQGKRRMAGRSFRCGTAPNPNPGSHYPAVQSFLDRARRALAEGLPGGTALSSRT